MRGRTTTPAQVAALVLVLGGSALAAGCGGSASKPPQIQPATGILKPPPPAAVVQAEQAGKLAVGLAATRRGARNELVASVVAPSGAQDGLAVSFRTGGKTVTASPCGSGCYRALAAPSRAVTVVVGRRPAHEVAFELPARLPAPSAAVLVRRATNAFRRLRAVEYIEQLSSGPGTGIVSTWTQVAPNRFAYRIRKGAAAVVVGAKRWDKTSPRGRWIRTTTSPLRVPEPIWGGSITNAHLLGTTRIGGRQVDVVSLFNSGIPAWFTIDLDAKTLRPVSLKMTAAAHFMQHDYKSFGPKLKVVPPK